MNSAMLHLMHLVSPALPVGAYAYSQGLEFAIDQQWLTGEAEVSSWIENIMRHSVGQLDAPVMARCFDAWQKNNMAGVHYWNEWLLACRETKELLLEDQQLGQALQRLLRSLNVDGADEVFATAPSFASQFALACCHWQIPKKDALQGFIFSWLENQIAAATKIVPLGQTRAQQMLMPLLAKIPEIAAHALLIDDGDMGISLPGLAMASAQHERQYSRLFRS
jgi:urease accessory protein